MGRVKWVICQTAALFLRCFCVMALTAGLSVLQLLPRAEWEKGWGKLLYTIAFSGTELPYDILYIRYEALEKYTPVQLMTMGILTGTLVLLLLSMLTMFFSVFINRIVGTAIAGALVVFMFVCQNQMSFMNGALRFFSPVTWMRVMWNSAEKYGIPVLPPPGYIFSILIGFNVVLECLIVWRIKKTELYWEKEEGGI